MNTEVYQHYGKEERVFIDQVFDWMQTVENRYAPYLTGFLTPREAMIVSQLVATNDNLKVYFNGGYATAERQRALIIPPYFEVDDSLFDLAYLNIKFPAKFAEITHGKILGTLLSTGINREKIGDIITDGAAWHIILDAKIKSYMITNVTKIANVGVHLEAIEPVELLTSAEQWETQTIIVTSLRLDALISKVYHFSRQRSKDAIAAGYVKMNFMEMTRSDIDVKEQDIISVRKQGRFWIQSIDGMTKKDNYRLTVNILVK